MALSHEGAAHPSKQGSATKACRPRPSEAALVLVSRNLTEELAPPSAKTRGLGMYLGKQKAVL